MMNPIRARALAVALIAVAAMPGALFAGGGKTDGFVRIEGFQGTSKDAKHSGWFDCFHHDIEVSDTPGETCKVVIDATLDQRMPPMAPKVGDVLDEVLIELVGGKHHDWYYRATLTDATVRKVVTSGSSGVQYERLELRPDSIKLEVRVQQPDGSFGAPAKSIVSCGVVRP